MQQVLVDKIELNTLLEKVSLLEKEVEKLKGKQTVELVKMQDACKILPLKATSITKLIAEGRIKKAEKIGSGRNAHWVFNKAELIELSESIFQS